MFKRFWTSTVNNLRKRNFAEIREQEVEITKENDNSAGNEDGNYSTVMCLFKKAKMQEESNINTNIFVPKLKTVKKKTFMRSIATNKF